MTNNRIWLLLGKRASGDISPAEKTELETLLKADPEAAATQALIQAIWHTPLQDTGATPGSSERVWEYVSQQVNTAVKAPARTFPLRRILIPAAAAVLLLFSWTSWQWLRPMATPALLQANGAPGGKSRITLPDGTQVWLNGNSSISYDKDCFGKKHREVTLCGEAFFDVVSGHHQPFIVHAGKVDIRVLGTAFNVKAYTADSMVATTLLRGKVAVSFREQTLVLHPEEKLSVPTTAVTPVKRQQLQKDSSGAVADISWLQHKLVFDNNTFAELAGKMNNWYGVTIHFESAGLQQLRFSGIIDTEPIDEALKTLQLSSPFHFQINGKTVWISK